MWRKLPRAWHLLRHPKEICARERVRVYRRRAMVPGTYYQARLVSIAGPFAG
jgi:hypothetical protein